MDTQRIQTNLFEKLVNSRFRRTANAVEPQPAQIERAIGADAAAGRICPKWRR